VSRAVSRVGFGAGMESRFATESRGAGEIAVSVLIVLSI
jgi:hypothetical protein